MRNKQRAWPRPPGLQVLKPKRFLKTNKRLPELRTQGFYQALKLPFFFLYWEPPVPNFKIQIKHKVMPCISMGVFKLCFSEAEKGDCFILFLFCLSTGKFFIFSCEGTAWINHSVLTQEHHCACCQTPLAISWLSRSSFILLLDLKYVLQFENLSCIPVLFDPLVTVLCRLILPVVKIKIYCWGCFAENWLTNNLSFFLRNYFPNSLLSKDRRFILSSQIFKVWKVHTGEVRHHPSLFPCRYTSHVDNDDEC